MDQTLFSPEVCTVLIIGGGGTALAAVGLLAETRPAWRPVRMGFVPLALLLAALSMAATASGLPAGVWAPLAVLGVCSGLIGAAAVPGCRRTCFAVARRASSPIALCLIALAVSPAFAFYWPKIIERQLPALEVSNVEIDARAPDLEENAGSAVTDNGRPVPLFYDQHVTPAPDVLRKEASLLESEELVNRMIRTAGPDETYNCHGWVFSGGLGWVKGQDVSGILDDNAYQPVHNPQAGDLAIYRNEAGTVVHTAIVRATGENGFVLLESKWGRMGRYIHAPDVQLYAASFTYYRSLRSGHLLRGLSAKQAELKDVDISMAL